MPFPSEIRRALQVDPGAPDVEILRAFAAKYGVNADAVFGSSAPGDSMMTARERLAELTEDLARGHGLGFTAALEGVKTANPELVRQAAGGPLSYRLTDDADARETVLEVDPRHTLRELTEKRMSEKTLSYTAALEEVKRENAELVEQIARTYGSAGVR